MKTLSALLASVALASFSVQAEPEIKGTAPELAQYLSAVPKIVAVTGEAEVRVPAHHAVVTLRVTTENKSLQEALRQNADLRAKLTDVLKKQEIGSDRIRASKFSSTPKFGIWSEKAKSYRVENMLRVSLQDEKEFQSIAGAVDAFPEVQFGEMEFEYADREALRQKAISQACDNANERRKIYEEKLNLKLTPTSFGEGIALQQNAANRYGVSAKPAMSDGYLTSGLRNAVPATEAVADESASSFGELVYTARVTVEYTAQPK